MIDLAITALASGGIAAAVILLLAFFALAYGLYTRRGSGISGRPSPGAGPEDRDAALDEASEEIRNMGRGTGGRRRSPR